MLIIALVLAVIGLAALVFAVVTGTVLVAWVCIGASLLGVLLLIVDALRERRRSAATGAEPDDESVDSVEETYENFDADYPEDADAAGDDAEDTQAADDETSTDAPGS